MKAGRNHACPCGSGRKYKKCCGTAHAEAATPLPPAAQSELAGLLQAGRYAELEAKARHLLEQYPLSGLVTKVLALALWSQGKPSLQIFERAAELLPDDAEAHGNLGNAYRALGQLDNAVRSHRRALEIDPQYAKSHNDLGSTLQDLGSLEEAAAGFRRAVAIEPDFALAYSNLGNLLALQNRIDEAQVQCLRALKIYPALTGAIVTLAEIQAARGDFAAAEKLLKHAISLEPEMPEAWAGLVRMRKMTSADVVWLTEALRIASLPLPPRREVHLRFALGKYFDDVADYEQAFANYQRANDLAKTGVAAYDSVKHMRAIDRILASHDRGWLRRTRLDDVSVDDARLDDAGLGTQASPRPVFIVGMPRSGTTLTEQILASHADVHGAGELPFWGTAASRYDAARAAGANERGILHRVRREYTDELRRLAPDASWVVDKMPGNFLYLGLIHAALPEARVIHLKRNPFDTCLSIYFQNFGPGHSYANDLDDLGHYYAEYVRVMGHWRRTLPPEVILDVAYEDLVRDPQHWSRQMLEFMGLPWDAACLDFHRSTRTVATLSKWQARQSITQASVARWCHYERFLLPLRRALEAEVAGTGGLRRST